MWHTAMYPVHFVYRPCSGVRWIAGATPREGINIPVVVWSNGCAHVIGRRIQLYTATPKSWWRDTARNTAVTLARWLNGVAWDDNGHVSLVVPDYAIQTALAVMWATDPFTDYPLGKYLHHNISSVRTYLEALGTSGILSILNDAKLLNPNGRVPLQARIETDRYCATNKPVVVFYKDNESVARITAPWEVDKIYSAVVVE